VSRTLQAVDLALKKVAAAIEIGSTERLLEGPVIKPVFRKFN
jgi:glutamate-1-semialdehyde 2,1-aminomutase